MDAPSRAGADRNLDKAERLKRKAEGARMSHDLGFQEPENPRFPYIVVQLSGEDGGALQTIGRVRLVMRDRGVPVELRDAFLDEATRARSSADVLAVVRRWVGVG